MTLSPRTIGLSAVGILIVGALLFVTFRTAPVAVDLHEVTSGPMQVTVNADGTTRIRNVFDVAAPISGTALRAPVEIGDPVLAGETVVAIVEPGAPALLDARTRMQAEAGVREAQAALDVSQSEVRQAEEDLAFARSQFDRTSELVERGVASITRLENDEATLSVREAALDAAASRLVMSQGSLERAEAALFDPAAPREERGEDCCVQMTAPADGVVLDVPVISERPVTVGATLVSVGDPGDLEIVADLLSSDAVRLAVGAEAIVERWGGPTDLRAVLRTVEPVAATEISALGIEEQRVDAVLDIVSPPEERPGLGHNFAVFLRVIEWRTEDTLQVPLSAVFRNDGTWHVFVAEGGTARITPVELGRRNDQSVQVLGGIEAGQRVITHPNDQIEDGTSIEERGAG